MRGANVSCTLFTLIYDTPSHCCQVAFRLSLLLWNRINLRQIHTIIYTQHSSNEYFAFISAFPSSLLQKQSHYYRHEILKIYTQQYLYTHANTSLSELMAVVLNTIANAILYKVTHNSINTQMRVVQRTSSDSEWPHTHFF